MPHTRNDRLDTWKEIAAHLRSGVRTVQRWERTCGMPVRRHGHTRASAVYAFRSELDTWWTSRSLPLTDELSSSRDEATTLPIEVVAVPRGRAKVALIPFPDLSPAQDQRRFCDGLLEELRTTLAGVARVQMHTRNGTQTIVEGSVRKGDSAIRVSVRIGRPTNDIVLSFHCDGAVGQELFLQKDVASRIVGALSLSARQHARLDQCQRRCARSRPRRCRLPRSLRRLCALAS